MAAKKYLKLNNTNGRVAEQSATIVSAGVANEGDIVALDSTGRIDVSVLPIGVGPDFLSAVTSENVSSGDYVNVFNNAGTITVRRADQSNDRAAHGFVKAGVTSPAAAIVFFEGPNENRSGLTLGARYFLNTVGGVTATPPTTGLLQFLGIAVASTTLNTDIDQEIERN